MDGETVEREVPRDELSDVVKTVSALCFKIWGQNPELTKLSVLVGESTVTEAEEAQAELNRIFDNVLLQVQANTINHTLVMAYLRSAFTCRDKIPKWEQVLEQGVANSMADLGEERTRQRFVGLIPPREGTRLI